MKLRPRPIKNKKQEGVVLIDPSVRDKTIFAQVLAAFRYGREDLEVLGLTFRKDLYLASTQVYPCTYAGGDDSSSTSDFNLANPPVSIATGNDLKDGSKSSSNRRNSSDLNGTPSHTSVFDLDSTPLPLTRLQERLIKKLGSNAFPFYFKLPPDSPASVTLQHGQNENGKPCGVDYELQTFMADISDEKLHKRNSVKLAVRKLTYAPEEPAPQPSSIVVKEFIMSHSPLRLEVSLDKEKYYHGETISVNVMVDNNSNKTVKKIKLSIRQCAQLCLHNSNRYTCTVDEIESDESFPILPSQTGWCKVYHLKPLLEKNRHKQGLALDGKLKNESINLASSTFDVCLELPFTLTHPKPVEEAQDDKGLDFHEFDDTQMAAAAGDQPDNQTTSNQIVKDLIDLNDDPLPPNPNPSLLLSDLALQPQPVPATSTTTDQDDLIFQDFARLRLQEQSKAVAEGSKSDGMSHPPSNTNPFLVS